MSKRATKVAKSNWKHVDGGMAFVIPVTLLKHRNWMRLGPHTVKLVLDLGRQFSGRNNGYLCPAWEAMQSTAEGWKSRETLYIAIAEAEHYGIIAKTLQGGRNRASRYAFTWWPIDHIDDLFDLDVAKTFEPSNSWKIERPDFELPEWVRRSRQKRSLPAKGLHAQRAA